MKSAYQLKKEKRDQKVYKRYTKLVGQPGAMKYACVLAIMKEFGFAHHETVYKIIRRAEAKNQAPV